jgi:hypothetical protein
MLTSLGTPGRNQLINTIRATSATAAPIAIVRLKSESEFTAFQ